MKRFLTDYGMILALLVLCVFFSWVTWDEQHPGGASGANQVADSLCRSFKVGSRFLIVAREDDEDRQFTETLAERLRSAGLEVVETVRGTPMQARQALEKIARSGDRLEAIACSHSAAQWPLFKDLGRKLPELSRVQTVAPRSYRWPNFLKPDNLLNVANQIVVIAVIAIGMTMVIITGGIDLSVGSLIALSAVMATRLIRDVAGAEQATPAGMILCSLAGMAICAVMGAFSGGMITFLSIPPFIVTLGMMLVASGTAYILAQGQSIYQVPEPFTWLGRGKLLAAVPNSVVMMVALYAVAHVVMSRMSLGRYIYAVGGNVEAARLSGVPVNRVLLFVYTVCGGLAGLGGIVTASQLKSGSPTYGLMYELYVIAAVVVGGTSLSGGQGKVFGTLIGAFIIAVIQNGMNLTGVESYTQKVVLGLVILGAVLLDRLKRRGLSASTRRGR